MNQQQNGQLLTQLARISSLTALDDWRSQVPFFVQYYAVREGLLLYARP